MKLGKKCAIWVAAAAMTAGLPVRGQEAVCDASSFKGAFGYTMSGSFYDNRGYVYLMGAAGRMITDGQGKLKGTDTFSYDGSAVRRTFEGTYTVNEDCTGTMTFNSSNNLVTNMDFVIVSDGKEVLTVQTDSNIILTGTLKQQKTPVTTPPAASETAAARR